MPPPPNASQPPTLLLVKEVLFTGHDSHFAGGVHLASCLAQQLSSALHAVHTFSAATKAVVLHHALTHSLLPLLRNHTTSCGSSSVEVVSWQQGCLHHHVVLRQQAASSTSSSDAQQQQQQQQPSPSAAAALLAAVTETARRLAAEGHAGCVLLDADTLQHAHVPAVLLGSLLRLPLHPAGSAAASGQQQACQQHRSLQTAQADGAAQSADTPWMLALSQALQQLPCHQPASTQHNNTPDSEQQQSGHDHHQQQQQQQRDGVQATTAAAAAAAQGKPWPLLVLVQNLHHLPLGPCGTAPRTPAALQGWRLVAGIISVSHFVRAYLLQHALPLLPQLQPEQVHAVHPAAFGVWGAGPFADLGSKAAASLWGSEGGEGCQAQPQSMPAQQRWQQAPVVGMLKLTRDKGSDLLLALAARLRHLQFRAVCADPLARQQAAQAGVHNLQLLQPVEDVSTVLQDVALLLVPSVLQEAFGMVVLDAMLHGLPVVVAAAGALPEAAAGAAAAVLPVALAVFPPREAHPDAAACAGAGDGEPRTGSLPASSGGDGCRQIRGAAASEQASGGEASTGCVPCWLAGQRSWHSREYPPHHAEDVDSCAGAVQGVLSDRGSYLEACARSRIAAARVLQEGPAQLAGLVSWLRQLQAG